MSVNNRKKQQQKNKVERTGVNTLSNWLDDSGQIIPHLQSNDKTDDIDGTIVLIEDTGETIGTLEVQVKSRSKVPTSPSFGVSKHFLEYCRGHNVPVILVVVYFWEYMSKPKCNELLDMYYKKRNKASITLAFQQANYIDAENTQHCVPEFIKIIENQIIRSNNYDAEYARRVEVEKENAEIRDKYLPAAIGETSIDYKEIHIFLDYYNDLLDNDFFSLKKALYPDYWKIGIGIRVYIDKAASYILYPISFETNDVQIKKIDNEKFGAKESEYFKAIKGYTAFANNPIKLYPKAHAYELIKRDLLGMGNDLKIQLMIKDFFLATEELFNFINNNYHAFGLQDGQNLYKLDNIKNSIDMKFLDVDNLTILPSSKRINLKMIRELIQYLKSMGIHDISRDNYYSLFNLENDVLIKTRKNFYDVVSNLYDLFVNEYFPNLTNELKFFNDYNLMIFTIDLSPRAKLISSAGVEICYHLKSLTPAPNKIAYFASIKDCPADWRYFKEPFEFENVQYLLKSNINPILNPCEQTPLIKYINNLLGLRLAEYLGSKIIPLHQAINM